MASFLTFERQHNYTCSLKSTNPPTPPPGRPIVSANCCLWSNGPLPQTICRTFTNIYTDKSDLLRKIYQLPQLPNGTLLVTLDVVSLYTNIPSTETLKVAKATLVSNRDDSNEPLKNNDIIRLLALVLRCNNFDFNGEHFLQTQGVAMGAKAAPTIANLVMGDFENTHVYTYHIQLWSRFIDNLFMLWPHGKESLLEFVQHLNSVHHSLKFTCESSEFSLPMLETRIIKE